IPLLQAGTSDPELRSAIPTIVHYIDADYEGAGRSTVWGGAHAALVRSGIRDRDGNVLTVDMARADALINRFCLLYMRTFPGRFAESTRRSIRDYLAVSVGADPGNMSGLRSTMGAKMLAIQKIRSAPFRDVPGARDIEMSKRNEWVENAHLRFLQGAYFQAV